MNLLQNKELFRQIFLFSPQPSIITSDTGELLYINKAAERLLGYSQDELLLPNKYARIFIELKTPNELLEKTKQSGYIENIPVQYRLKSKDTINVLYSARFVELGIEKYIIATMQKVSSRHENKERYSHNILEMLTSNYTFTQILTQIAYFIEDEIKGSVAAILLVDENDNKLRHSAGPSLPDSYIEAIDGLDIGPSVSTCGIAAYTGERVITEDLLKHPYWESLAGLLKKTGVRSCWAEPIKNSQGKVLGIFTIYSKEVKTPNREEIELISGISQLARIAIEHNQIQEALRYSEKQYKLITENSTDIIWTLGPSGRFTYVSPSSEAILGYTQEEMLTKKFADVVLLKYAKTLDQNRNKIMEIVSSGIPVSEEMKTKPPFKESIEVEQIKKDGSILWTEINFNTVFDPNNRFINIVGITRDISKRKETEERLRESEELFSAIVYTSPDGIGMTDMSGAVTYISEKLLHIIGYDRFEEVQGKSILTLFAPEYKEKVAKKIADLFKKIPVSPEEYIFHKKDGTPIWLEISIQVLQGFDKIPVGTFFIARDVSDRKESEAKLKEYTDKLKELNAIKDRYFSIIAHDLRNPFTSLRGITAIMQNKLENKQYDELDEYVKILDMTTERTHELLENLLEWSLTQIEDGISFNPRKLQLAKLIYNITLLQANSIESNNINLNIDVSENIHLQADRNMIETILRNLFSNAMKFTPDGGNISISAELIEANNMVKISITDSGIGIKPENIEKLFKIETNYSTYGTRHEKGTGLGLILCREFVERHGGRIWVESEEGKGSTFNFTLPVAR